MAEIIQTISLALLPVTLAITLHEAAHGYVARYFGDPTAHEAGRITLNPFRHIDLVGTILVPLAILLVSGGGMLFGWAKPVPVNFGRLRRPKSDMMWVAGAGPAANLAMALFWAAMFKLAWTMPENAYQMPLALMSQIGISINVVLMVLNLLPLPPLDGGRIAVSLLPHGMAWRFAQLERWGFPILLAMLFTGVLGAVLSPMVSLVRTAIGGLFGFPG